MRQGEEHHVVARQDVDVGGVEHPVGQRQQMRVVLGERGARAGGGGQCADGQPSVGVRRVAKQQPQDLSAGVAAGTGHRDRSHAAILHGYAQCCKSIYELAVCVGKRLETVFDVSPLGTDAQPIIPAWGDTH